MPLLKRIDVADVAETDLPSGGAAGENFKQLRVLVLWLTSVFGAAD